MAIRKEVHKAKDIVPTLRRPREAIAKTGKSAVIKVWIDSSGYAPGTKNRTMSERCKTACRWGRHAAFSIGRLRETSNGNT